MTRIICRATTCLFWERGVCGSEEIEYEPDDGCLTFQDMGDLALEDEDEDDYDWEDDEEEDDDDDDIVYAKSTSWGDDWDDDEDDDLGL